MFIQINDNENKLMIIYSRSIYWFLFFINILMRSVKTLLIIYKSSFNSDQMISKNQGRNYLVSASEHVGNLRSQLVQSDVIILRCSRSQTTCLVYSIMPGSRSVTSAATANLTDLDDCGDIQLRNAVCPILMKGPLTHYLQHI